MVILYVHAIQRRSSSVGDHLPTLQSAIKCQSQLSSLARPGSLSERYGVVLGELRLELFRHKPDLSGLFPQTEADLGPSMQLLPNDNTSFQNLELPVDMGAVGVDTDGLPDDQGAAFLGPSPSSSVAQMTGWERFDSLVSSDYHPLGGKFWPLTP